MKLAVLGTGMVGDTIASKLTSLGHDVRMGARDAANAKAQVWAQKAGAHASHGTFADAAAFGELAFLCVNGQGALEVIGAAGKHLDGKILIDVTNPLDFSKGMPPSLFTDKDSLGERVQHAAPGVHVVKSLNTVNANVMVEPSRLPGVHDVFVSGNDAGAKAKVTEILKDWFGWKRVVDLGDITTARGTEAYLLLWVRLYGALQTPDFNVSIVRA